MKGRQHSILSYALNYNPKKTSNTTINSLLVTATKTLGSLQKTNVRRIDSNQPIYVTGEGGNPKYN
jgi:hypothetical protein